MWVVTCLADIIDSGHDWPEFVGGTSRQVLQPMVDASLDVAHSTRSFSTSFQDGVEEDLTH